jgi:DNA-binding NarL/FixJ family response regulator
MRILLAAPDGLFAAALGSWLAHLCEGVHVRRCDRDPRTALPGQAGLQLVLVELDGLAQTAALAVIAGFRDLYPSTPLIALSSALDDAFASEVLRAGAQAHLPKSLSETRALSVIGAALQGKQGARVAAPQESPGMQDVLPRSSDGRFGLTARELEMLELACGGLSNLEISRRCAITEGVVKLHLHRAYQKLGVQGRLQAARIVEHLDRVREMRIGRIEDRAALLDWLLPHMSHEVHRKGQVLFRKGEPGDAMYYLQRGSVQLPEIEAEMHEGDVFGEIGIFAPGRARTSSARCASEVHVFRLTAEHARRLCFENPQFAYYLIRLVADRLAEERQQAREGPSRLLKN